MSTVKTQRLKYVVTSLVSIFIFLIPSNLFIKLVTPSAYINGLLVDYLLPKFYVSDIPILALIGLNCYLKPPKLELKKVKENALLFCLFGLFVLRQFLSPFPVASVWFVTKLVEMVLLTWSLLSLRHLFIKSGLVATLILTTIFQSLIGLLQFFSQRSVSGYLFLGEGNLSSISGIAKASFNGVEKILPYGTTAHPNILGAFILIFLLLIWQETEAKWQIKPVIFLGLVIIYLTQSQAVWVAGVSSLLVLRAGTFFSDKAKWLLVSGLLVTSFLFSHFFSFWPDNWSWQRRLTLNQASINYFIHHPLFGTGLNTNAGLNEQVLSRQEITRFAQPAHHVGLLWLSETGCIGLFIAYWFMKKLAPGQTLWLIGLLPLFTLDHYLLTLQSGLLLATLSLVWAGGYQDQNSI